MNRWRCFLDSLDTGGGHMFVLFVLILVGYHLFQSDSTAGGQIITGSFGALLMMLRNTGSNKDQMGTTTTVAASTHTDPPPAPVVPPVASAPPPAP